MKKIIVLGFDAPRHGQRPVKLSVPEDSTYLSVGLRGGAAFVHLAGSGPRVDRLFRCAPVGAMVDEDRQLIIGTIQDDTGYPWTVIVEDAE